MARGRQCERRVRPEGRVRNGWEGDAGDRTRRAIVQTDEGQELGEETPTHEIKNSHSDVMIVTR